MSLDKELLLEACKEELKDYLNNLNKIISNSESSISKDSIPQLHIIFHTMRTSSKIAGSSEFSELCTAIEAPLKIIESKNYDFDNKYLFKILNDSYLWLHNCYEDFFNNKNINNDELSKNINNFVTFKNNLVKFQTGNKTTDIADNQDRTINNFKPEPVDYTGEGTVWKIFSEQNLIQNNKNDITISNDDYNEGNYISEISSLIMTSKDLILCLEEEWNNPDLLKEIINIITELSKHLKIVCLSEIDNIIKDILVLLIKTEQIGLKESHEIIIDILPICLDMIFEQIQLYNTDSSSKIDTDCIVEVIKDFSSEIFKLEKSNESKPDLNKKIAPLSQKQMGESKKSAIPKALMEKFCLTTHERLQLLTNDLLYLEEHPENEDKIKEILSEMHTLKGESKIMQCDEINHIAHYVEDVLKIAGNNECIHKTTDEIINSLDAIKSLISSIENEEQATVDYKSICSNLETFAQKITQGKYKTDKPNVLIGHTDDRIETKVDAKPLAPVSRTKKQESLRVKLAKLQEVTNLVEDLNIRGSASDFSFSKIQKSGRFVYNILKDITKLREELIDLKEKNPSVELNGFFKNLSKTENNVEELNSSIKQYVIEQKDLLFYMNLSLKDLYEHVRSLKMVPISTLFETYPRAIRDMAQDMGKKIRVSIEGGETELDKNMVDAINDPMIHLLRNSVDHGIESPDDRVKVNKNERGTISIKANQKGNTIIISLVDDGKGINKEILLEKAIEKGLVSPKSASSFSESDIYNLLFQSGFSTRDNITHYSGRGVGLDSVKKTIERYEGKIEVSSQENKGTTFSLSLPISTAVIKAMPVIVEKTTFFIPSVHVSEVCIINHKQILNVDNVNVFKWRNRLVPILSMTNFLGIKVSTKRDLNRIHLVILEYFDKHLGFEVDNFVDEKSILLRSLGTFLLNVSYISGSTILEDGSIALVLNIGAIFDSVIQQSKNRKFTVLTKLSKTQKHQKSLLIVDDSPIIREVQKNILSSAGYSMTEAENGVDALMKLDSDKFDLILSDIEMPKMNGFELTEKIKNHEHFKKIPVIIMSTRSSENDKLKGAEAGCDAYLVKSEFSPELLLSTIKRVLPE